MAFSPIKMTGDVRVTVTLLLAAVVALLTCMEDDISSIKEFGRKQPAGCDKVIG